MSQYKGRMVQARFTEEQWRFICFLCDKEDKSKNQVVRDAVSCYREVKGRERYKKKNG